MQCIKTSQPDPEPAAIQVVGGRRPELPFDEPLQQQQAVSGRIGVLPGGWPQAGAPQAGGVTPDRAAPQGVRPRPSGSSHAWEGQQQQQGALLDLSALPAGLYALPALNSLVRRCWQARPVRRPTASELHAALCALVARDELEAAAAALAAALPRREAVRSWVVWV
jgi:hypothetical protein